MAPGPSPWWDDTMPFVTRASRRSLRGVSIVMLLAATQALPATAQQTPEPVLYELLPADRDYPIARVCSTSEGICALPLFIPPGRQCECRREDGSWVSGICTH
jgi:hypothetical protein